MKTLHTLAALPLLFVLGAHAQTGAGSGSGNASSTSAGFNSSSPAPKNSAKDAKSQDKAALAATGDADLKRGADRASAEARLRAPDAPNGVPGAGTGTMTGPGGVGGTR